MMIKPYIQSDKTFMTFEDPSLPEGFRLFEQMRPTGKHVDREFMTPDGFFILRSKIACTEYVKLMEQLEDEPVEEVDDIEEENEMLEPIIEINSPVKRPAEESFNNSSKRQKSFDFGPASFKAKLKKKLDETQEKHADIIKYLPKGTKIKFAPTMTSTTPTPVIRTGRGVTITPVEGGESAKTSTPFSSKLSRKNVCCGKSFISEAGLKKHEEKQHSKSEKTQGKTAEQNKVVKMKEISNAVKITPVTSKHQSLTKQKFKCYKCPVSYDEKSQLSEHVTTVHFQKYECPECQAKFPTKTALKHHKEEKHVIVNCKDCPETFPTRLAMLEHKRDNHILPCKICNKVFNVKTKLEEHHKANHNNKCTVCSEEFQIKPLLSRHMREKHMNPCSSCKEIFETKEKLDAHIVEKHSNCLECEDEFQWPDSDHVCYYTKQGVGPKSDRVIEQRLYRGYFYFSLDD